MITVEISSVLLDRHRKAIEDGGPYDGTQVWVRFLTQQDSSVRPSHAALHGTIWKADDLKAPAPPLDYGCRCWLEYVAQPDSLASRFFKPADADPENGLANPFAKWLEPRFPDWRAIAKRAAEDVPVAERLSRIYQILTDRDAKVFMPRDVARMIFEAWQEE